VESHALLRCARQLAAACLLARNWDPGSRDEIAAALIGVLDSREWTAADIRGFLEPIRRPVGDEESRDRLYKIERTPRARAEGAHIYGLPKLVEKLGQEVVNKLVEWLELDARPGSRAARLPLDLRSAFDIVNTPVKASWLLRPYLEEYAIAVLTGDFGTFKSFLALDWALHLATGKRWYNDPRAMTIAPQPVVFISAEGRGLNKRIRAWVAHHFPDSVVDDVLKTMAFYAIEAAVNLSDPEKVKALCTSVDALKISPCLIILDTLSRNSSFVEESNSQMAQFLNAIDAGLRQKYHCSLLLIHHVGHGDKTRARGPSNLIGNTDASFLVYRDDKSYYFTLETERLKDSDVPEPFKLEAREIPLNTLDESGQSEKSLVLIPTTVIRFKAQQQKPAGKNQEALLTALRTDVSERGGEGWTKEEITAIAKRLGLSASRRREVLEALRKKGLLVQKDGVWLLAD
jgi:hypothetical protein